MKQNKLFYFNDARHYYLFVYEPPISMENAWGPVDEVANTGVDTFVYGIARGDGLFYPSKVGKRFGVDMDKFSNPMYWRVWNNMQSLIDRGLDPLQVLIDRAHEKNMDFHASFRMGTYEALANIENDEVSRLISADPTNGGDGLADPLVREKQLLLFQELIANYDIDGLELDFACHPGGAPAYLNEENVAQFTPTITDYVSNIRDIIKSSGRDIVLGARIYPFEKTNLKFGIDIRRWIDNQVVDYFVPMMYHYMQLDPDMPVKWLLDLLGNKNIGVYPLLQPYIKDKTLDRDLHGEHELDAMIYADKEHFRSAASNLKMQGVNGFCSWFLKWPLGDEQKTILNELKDTGSLKYLNKTYCLAKRVKGAADLGYETSIPIEISSSTDDGEIYFNFSDGEEDLKGQLIETTLLLRVKGIVNDDEFNVSINGAQVNHLLSKRYRSEYIRRPPSPHIIEPYSGQVLEFKLSENILANGLNKLSIGLLKRPDRLDSAIILDDVNIKVKYS
jgi:hypothetical protein